MANANYKLREVSASEIAKVFGSARRALRVTRGDDGNTACSGIIATFRPGPAPAPRGYRGQD